MHSFACCNNNSYERQSIDSDSRTVSFFSEMFSKVVILSIVAYASAFHPMSSSARGRTSLSMTAPPGMKPMFDGTFKKAGEHSEQYTLEMDNGAKAIVRSFGGNAFSYITKDGVEVMGLVAKLPLNSYFVNL